MNTIAEFRGDYRAMCCGGCVRCMENPKKRGHYLCSDIDGPDEVTADTRACEAYWDRAKQDALDALNYAQDELVRQARWAKNKDNAPRPAKWERDWDEMRECWTGEYPVCPNCDEPLYQPEQCFFCGQLILQDERMEEHNKPAEVMRMDCFLCGGKDTMAYTVSSYNSHKRGHCEKCGAKFIE